MHQKQFDAPKPLVSWRGYTQLNSTQQDITDVGADTSYVRIYMSNLIKTLRLWNFFWSVSG